MACVRDYKFLSISGILDLVAFPLLLLAPFILDSCSANTNTAARRQWEAFNTRYNVFFNGIESFNQELAEMERNYTDNYSRLIPIHPAEAFADQRLPQPSGDFSRAIEKMQKAIELHSISKKPAFRATTSEERAFRARDEFNPFIHNAWINLGKAQYYSGDFSGAATTFLYITRHFKWLPEVVTEARLWEALSYCALGMTYDAENVLHFVKEKELTTKSLKFLYNLAQADYSLKSGKTSQAIPYLKSAAEGASGIQKNRLWFLLGQVCSLSGETSLAYEAFKKAGGGLSTPYHLKFNARIKQSESYSGPDVINEINDLKRLARYERNKELLDRIYYGVANLYMAINDSVQAENFYKMSVAQSVNQDYDRAVACLALANLYFSKREYLKAQPLYAESMPFLSEEFPNYKSISRLTDILDELALYAGNVSLQDSLLHLSSMPERQRIETVKKMLADLQTSRNHLSETTPVQSDTLTSFALNSDNSWYFYNPRIRARGQSEFVKKWGIRKPEDDWRRSNKNSFSFDDNEENEFFNIQSSESLPGKIENDPLRSYLDQIPLTPTEIALSNDVIQQGLFNMGLIYKDKLNDFTAAQKEFNTLLARYPESPQRLDAIYNLYIMDAREDRAAEADKWRNLILSEFPESSYAIAMADPRYFEKLRNMYQIQESLYEDAYKAYLENDNEKVHSAATEMERDFPLSDILPKFIFLDALASLTDGDTSKFRQRLSELTKKWPDSDVSELAGTFLTKIDAGTPPVTNGSNPVGIRWEEQLTARYDAPASIQSYFSKEEADVPYYMVLVFPRDVVNPNLVLYEIARFNFSSFLIKDFDLEPISFSNMALLVVKGFQNISEVEKYEAMLRTGSNNIPEYAKPVIISKQNFELLLQSGKSFEDYFMFKEDSKVIENTPYE
ncbi:MAG: tetratricopeptide repeat protein [Muribaculaceae bacterium]|nr:tetratricopeptide repeat protein [Muribaculaceae bacterium]